MTIDERIERHDFRATIPAPPLRTLAHRPDASSGCPETSGASATSVRSAEPKETRP